MKRGGQGDKAPGRRRGRPSSKLVDRALAEAAVEEFVLRGYHAMSMESIAARAGVSKLSLYRRWSSKLAVTEEVFRALCEKGNPEDRGSLEADLRYLVGRSVGSPSAKSAAKLVLRTMGEICDNPALLAAYREHLLAPRMVQLRAVLERARARGELRAGVPTDAACALVAGPLFLYYLALLAGAELDLPGDLAAQFTRLILDGIAKPQTPSARASRRAPAPLP
ncbi:MAG TPA: TetR/AcrR family transcriptional regulator [Bryobacteraceae bacterium]